MKRIKFSNFFVVFLLMILLVQLPSVIFAENIGNVPSAFSNGAVFVTGKNANSLDLLTRDTTSKGFKEMGILNTNSLDFEVPSNKSLVVIGGPAINSKTKELNNAFGVRYEETQDRILNNSPKTLHSQSQR